MKGWGPEVRALFIAALLLPGPLRAQVPDSLRISRDSLSDPQPVIQLQEDTTDQDQVPGRISPRGAFIRSALVPGWGHAEVGAYGRGAFYFMVEAVSGFMLVKTHSRLNLARNRRALRESVLTDRLLESGIEDFQELEDMLAEDPLLEDLRGLETARSEQREDWMALGIFFLFLGGADAYVSAHLADFPGAVEVNATPSGGVEMGMSVPVNF